MYYWFVNQHRRIIFCANEHYTNVGSRLHAKELLIGITDFHAKNVRLKEAITLGVYVAKCRLDDQFDDPSQLVDYFTFHALGQRPSFSVFRCMNRGNDFSLSGCSRDTCTSKVNLVWHLPGVFLARIVCEPLISLPGLSLFLRNLSTLFTNKVNRCASLSVEAEFWKVRVLRSICLCERIIFLGNQLLFIWLWKC